MFRFFSLSFNFFCRLLCLFLTGFLFLCSRIFFLCCRIRCKWICLPELPSFWNFQFSKIGSARLITKSSGCSSNGTSSGFNSFKSSLGCVSVVSNVTPDIMLICFGFGRFFDLSFRSFLRFFYRFCFFFFSTRFLFRRCLCPSFSDIFLCADV